MQRRNTIVIWVVSVLIIIFTSVSVSPGFRIKIREFIGDDTSNYYYKSLKIVNIDSTSSEVLIHSIAKLNDYFIGYSKQVNGMIQLSDDKNLLYQNIQTQNCSSCHQKPQEID